VSERLKLRIDAAHSRKLMRGEAVTVKVPMGTRQVELRLSHVDPVRLDSFAKLCDVFFNGRPA
jgi:hypothetical protein